MSEPSPLNKLRDYRLTNTALLYQTIIDNTIVKCRGGMLQFTVTVPSKYKVMIPKRIREELGIEAGQKLEIIFA